MISSQMAISIHPGLEPSRVVSVAESITVNLFAPVRFLCFTTTGWNKNEHEPIGIANIDHKLNLHTT